MSKKHKTPPRLLNGMEVVARTTLPRNDLLALVDDGKFPRPRVLPEWLGSAAWMDLVWIEEEVTDWILSLPVPNEVTSFSTPLEPEAGQ